MNIFQLRREKDESEKMDSSFSSDENLPSVRLV